jgi:hypothetical protein
VLQRFAVRLPWRLGMEAELTGVVGQLETTGSKIVADRTNAVDRPSFSP